jgi:hypothetical protein
VAQRRWQCFCNGCIELLRVGPSALGASSLAVPGCVRASEAAYQSSKRTTNQLGSTAASQRSSKRRKDGSSLASKIKGPGTFCLFQNRAGHGDEELWLGRTTSVSPHLPQGQCTKHIPRRTTETIAEIRFDSGDHMIGVQWYAKGERGLYRRWDAEAPSLQNSAGWWPSMCRRSWPAATPCHGARSGLAPLPRQRRFRRRRAGATAPQRRSGPPPPGTHYN